ncbi:GNAT family N-acetyltransferase [Legionella israelensis]|uniref:GNAT family N-acetyltransferase n=1 Tax=Legionella israelensis TaxID=454 RepID=A0A0W0V4E6_9GAMM|nr:bifunctional GNAT family N-acetyltransferase/carbon-nitrogen hydrolase family protein [Legionella israelensis]KTD15008.1 nitrilase [Legionella israelensis]QBR85106.1 GNAT family N-acetyltransferase [Legionella israelensis]QBS10000.1 GNAT family N-acetyltransferase [Legionella israelensis]QDP71187.1 GNAT family N-acetyltransferase [Legionella israelensis]SCX77932.1 Predicted amidohydrolase [Legionella israelensis DSM 19235]
MQKSTNKNPKIIVRNAKPKDIGAIRELVGLVYPSEMENYPPDALRGHMNHYPQGQFVVEYENKIVGYCATFKISGEIALKPHTWDEITGHGFASRHDPQGDYIYGMEVCVHPDYRGLRIGNRLYTARKRLCQAEGLKGVVFGGRLPGYRRHHKKYPRAEDYLQAVIEKQIRDPVISFQLRNQFEPIAVLKNYLPQDKASMGYAAHLLWINNDIASKPDTTKKGIITRGRMVDRVRLSLVQYMQRRVHSFDEFARYVEYFVDVVADYYADFVLFPEMLTLQLLSIENEPLKPEKAILKLTEYQESFIELMSSLAVKYNINIIGGSHPTKLKDGVYNISYIFLRDGQIHEQSKIHPTPNERYWWNIRGGNELKTIATDCGPIAVLICYDCEFPELARHAINQGAKIIFVPFCTDERQSYMRVRYCAQARAVENQCYIVMAGNVGNLPGVLNMDIQYAQSAIFTPCDFPFARDGIAADTTPNVEMVSFADLSLHTLEATRSQGTVLNLKDRRHDLYSVKWKTK